MSDETDRLAHWAEEYVASRPPDFFVGPPDDHQMERWFVVPRNDGANVFLHRFLRSDPEDPHDHPFDNLSYILRGEYLEYLPGIAVTRRRGEIVNRAAAMPHRIEVAGPVLSLFVTGPRLREWGYHAPGGWVRWQDYRAEPRYDGRTGELIYGGAR